MNRMSRIADKEYNTNQGPFMQSDTEVIIQREKTRQHKIESRAHMNWKHAAHLAIKSIRSKRHYQDHMAVAHKEHMSDVDCFDGGKMRGGETDKTPSDVEEKGDLLVIHPGVDGRFKDIGRDS